MAFNPNEHLIDLKGKDYLQVMYRLVWFREDCPMWCINTEMIAHDTENFHAIFKAIIFDEYGVQKSSGYGSESVKDFRDYIEKAETKAVGRALAMLGYGTQFAPELDEGDKIVDSPVSKPKAPKKEPPIYKCAHCGKPITDTEFNGKKVRAEQIARRSKEVHGATLHFECVEKYLETKNGGKK